MRKIGSIVGVMTFAVVALLGTISGRQGRVTAAEAAGPATAAAASPAKPNVLFIISDDLRDWVGTFGGNPDTKTPNIDRLCRRGVAFLRAYTCAPLCNPTRAALLNGRMPSSTGVYDNRQPFRESEVLKDSVTLPQYFMQHGYHTVAAGKIYHMHFPDPASWDVYSPDGVIESKTAVEDEGDKSDKKAKKKAGTGSDSQDEEFSVAGITWAKLAGPESETVDYKIADYVIRQLGKQHDKPFFLGCGFRKPHLPWAVPRSYFDLFPPANLTLPKVKDDDLDDVPPIGRKWAKPQIHREIVAAGKWADGVSAYLASIAYMDAQLGRVLDALDASPYARNTIIVFFGDHGWHLGEKLHWHKSTLWEEADRAPFFMCVPGLTKPGGQCLRTVGFIDIYPTLVELCGLPAKSGLEGVSIVPLLKNPAMPWDRPAVTDFKYGNSAVRSERWRYIRYVDGTEELYDHEHDALEWTNLAGNPAYADVKKDLARWLPKSHAKDSPHQYFNGDKKKGKEEIDGE